MTDIQDYVQKRLLEMRDDEYREFNSRLLPTVWKENIIGVRIPTLRKFAKELSKAPGCDAFLKALPHTYFEENCLHGFIIETVKDFDKVISLLDEFLQFVDNWATCDCMSPKALGKNPEKLHEKALEWINSGNTYTVRFGVGVLMKYFLDCRFSEDDLSIAANIRSEEYYVRMMVAWYFATALAKQYDSALPYITERRLDVWTHNKTIQKASESYRIDSEKKALLKTFKIKNDA